MVVTCPLGMRSSTAPVSKQVPALSVLRYGRAPRLPDSEFSSNLGCKAAEARQRKAQA